MSAKAPYNFIPLNNRVVKAREIPDFNKYHDNRNSGLIELEIETQTPLYIRRAKDDFEFFNINGNPKIPGSSLRGMIRTLIEIVSYGNFKFFDDKRLYYRAIGDKTSLGQNYRDFFLRGIPKDCNIGLTLKVETGILKKEGEKYKIYLSRRINGIQYYRVNGKFNNNKEPTRFQINNVEINLYEFKKIYFKPEKEKVHLHKIKRKNRPPISIFLRYALVNEITDHPNGEHKLGYLVSSGHIGRKHMQWIINSPETQSIEVKEEIIKEYQSDSGRIKEANLLEKLEKYSNGVPVFCLLDSQNEVFAFGHTGFFRLPYKKTIGEHVPKDLKSDDIIDFAEAIFGIEGKWASRVFFEDADLIDGQIDIYLDEISPKILSSPKPTTFQHYLEQPNGKDTNWGNLKHWNDEVNIRGYKLYWHRNAPDDPNLQGVKYSWNEGQVFENNQHTKIRPVKRNVKFTSRIRFENLADEELGGLLFVLDLPENCYHRLGMGKPLGLGSIKITPKLYLIDRKKRYRALFDGDYWNEAKEERELDDLKEKFEKYILRYNSTGNTKNVKKLWNTPRLKQLKTILDWNTTTTDNWLEKTEYLTIKDFKNRRVLPKPEEIPRYK